MTTRPLLITADPELIDDVVRLGAVAGVELHLAPDPSSARMQWLSAPLVLIGSDVPTPIVTPGRRDGVVLVERDHDPDVWQRAVAIGAEHVACLPDAEPWLVERLGQMPQAEPGAGQMITVLGSGGGAGASTFAATLSLVASAEGRRVLLIDGDPLGGGLDVLLGIEAVPGNRWPDLSSIMGRIAAGTLASALPQAGGASVLSFARQGPRDIATGCWASVLDAAARDFDIVIVDLARTCLGVATDVLERSHVTVIVSANHVRSVAASARLASEVRDRTNALALVVRADAGGVNDDSVPRLVGLPLLATLPASPRLTVRSDEGELPTLRDAYARACRSALSRIGAAE